MPTNAFGQQVYNPNAGGNPLLSQLQQANANRPQPNGSNAYNWSGNGWLNDMNSTPQQSAGAGGFGNIYSAMPSVDSWAQGFQGNSGDQVRSSVATLSPGPTQSTNAQQMSGSQSAPQDRYGSAYEQNPNVTWSYGGQTTVNPLDRGQFLTQGAAQNLAGQLGQGYTNNAWQLGGPAAYSAPMQTINNLHNAGLVQQMLDRGMPIDQVRSQLDREAAMARGGTQTTLNNPGQAQSESERMYQSMGLVRGADGQWRTPQNAQQTGAANGAPQAQGGGAPPNDPNLGSFVNYLNGPQSQNAMQQRYGPLVSAMQQQRMGQGGRAMSDPGEGQLWGRGTLGVHQNEAFTPWGSLSMQGNGQVTQRPGPSGNSPMMSDSDLARYDQLGSRLNSEFGMGRGRQTGENTWDAGSPEQVAIEQEMEQIRQRNNMGVATLTGQGGPSSPFRNAMFGQRLGQYGQGDTSLSRPGYEQGGGSQYGQLAYTPNVGRPGGMGPAMGGGQQFPSMQQVRGGQANNLGYDPYYYGPQARGPQARQPGWQYPQNTGAFQLYNHGSQESNDLSAFNQRMQQQEQASMPAAWRTAQSAGRGGGGSWDWNQGARMLH